MKKVILIFIFLLLTISNNILSQVTQEWERRFHYISNDAATSIVSDALGNIYVTGKSFNGTSEDIVTIKYNLNGDSLWVRRYNGSANGNDYATSITVDESGNVYVTGSSTGNGTGLDYCTIKYNSSGDTIWKREYNGTGNGQDTPAAITVDELGNVYVTGYSIYNGTDMGYATIKYNSSGTQQWIKRYDISFSVSLAIAIDQAHNVFITGRSGYDFATIKYNSSGNEQWIKRYLNNGESSAYAIAIDQASNIYITGSGRKGSNSSTADYITIKYNTNGDTLWTQRYDGPGNNVDISRSIAIDGIGNVYVTGGSYGIGSSLDYATIKYNSGGVMQWVRRYNGPANDGDAARSIAIDGFNNIYVTGTSIGNGTNYDYATIKYNSSGVMQWVQRYDGTANIYDDACKIIIAGISNVYITGYSYGTSTGSDYLTIKYSQQVGIKKTSSEYPIKFVIEQNYPNPFNPMTKIQFDVMKAENIMITVFDVTGKELEILVNERMQPGTYEAEWNGEKYASGIYFYRMQAGNYVETRKMTLLK